MKKIITGLFLAMCVFSANAGWYAEAHSSSGYGWGHASSKSVAMDTALRQCAKYTYVWDLCTITLVQYR